ncbi:MAG: Lrp/AsnC family transcriptional regulator [Pseudomonadota bacterium]
MKLLQLLLKNGRSSFKSLAVDVGLTGAACAERIKRLKERGLLSGYKAEVDWVKLGFPVRALVRIGANAEHGQSLLELFAETPNVVEVHRVTGLDSYVLLVLAESSQQLENVIDKIGKYGTVTTSLVLSTPLTSSNRLHALLGSRSGS